MQQKKCDWIGCSEVGFFGGLDKSRLTDEGKRHIFALLKLIFLCPYHFKVRRWQLRGEDSSAKNRVGVCNDTTYLANLGRQP
jgi:hypothetical protein